jgi:FtsZ-binding cell division protein ZapB
VSLLRAPARASGGRSCRHPPLHRPSDTTTGILTPTETETTATAPSSAAAAASCRPAHKRALSSDRDAQSPAESNASTLPTRDGSVLGDQRTKKRRTTGAGPGARGVANLTPEQLAKKRANDREAQRAIRERTKNQIETLERRIRDLTSQQPYQELQAAIRAKEAVEAENADIKNRLASVMALLQPLLGSSQGDTHFS